MWVVAMVGRWIFLGALGQFIGAVAPAVTAGAACFAAWIAYRGLEKWRAETIGKRKAELAENVLADFYEARDIIRDARSPLSFGDEGQSRQKEAWETEIDTGTLNSYFRTFERLNKKREFFAQFHARRYRFLAIFGQEASKPYDELFRIYTEIVKAVIMLMKTHHPHGLDYQLHPDVLGSLPDERKKWEATIGGPHAAQDPVEERLKSARGGD